MGEIFYTVRISIRIPVPGGDTEDDGAWLAPCQSGGYFPTRESASSWAKVEAWHFKKCDTEVRISVVRAQVLSEELYIAEFVPGSRQRPSHEGNP